MWLCGVKSVMIATWSRHNLNYMSYHDSARWNRIHRNITTRKYCVIFLKEGQLLSPYVWTSCGDTKVCNIFSLKLRQNPCAFTVFRKLNEISGFILHLSNCDCRKKSFLAFGIFLNWLHCWMINILLQQFHFLVLIKQNSKVFWCLYFRFISAKKTKNVLEPKERK